MPRLYRASFVLSLAVLVLLLAQIGGVGVAAQEASPTATDVTPAATEAAPTPLPPPISAFLEGEAMVDALPDGSSTINVSTVIIAPRVALRAAITTGPVLILVNGGVLTIDADAALVGSPPTGLMTALQPEATPSPAQAVDFDVPDGDQVLLPANTRVQLRNTTDEEVVLRVITITPAGEAPFVQQTQ